MSNVLSGHGLTYYQIPDALVHGAGALLPKMSGKALALYHVIMARVQRKSSPVVELTTKEIITLTGMGKNYVTSAAQQLHDLRLVHMTQRKGAGWGFTFELLDIETGLPIPSQYDRQLDAGTLTKQQKQTYILHRLGTLFSYSDDNGIRATCPFHTSTKPEPALAVKISAGGLTWKCHHEKCPHVDGGHIIDFEVALAYERGERMSERTAWDRIVFVIRAAERKAVIEAKALQGAMAEMAGMTDGVSV